MRDNALCRARVLRAVVGVFCENRDGAGLPHGSVLHVPVATRERCPPGRVLWRGPTPWLHAHNGNGEVKHATSKEQNSKLGVKKPSNMKNVKSITNFYRNSTTLGVISNIVICFLPFYLYRAVPSLYAYTGTQRSPRGQAWTQLTSSSA
jgi:hypothetical protein